MLELEVDTRVGGCEVGDGRRKGGAYGLVEMIEVPADEMPPLHVHHTHDEGFLLLEGDVSLFLPGREVALRPGEYMLAPRGVPHTYQVGKAPARWINLSTPAGFEQFVEDVAALDELTPEALGATAAVRGIEILGPPGTMPLTRASGEHESRRRGQAPGPVPTARRESGLLLGRRWKT